MANINEGPKGTPDQGDGEVYLVHEEGNDVNGVHVRTALYSDGSRKITYNGVEENVPVFTDIQKANGEHLGVSGDEDVNEDDPAVNPNLDAGDVHGDPQNADQAEAQNAVARLSGQSTEDWEPEEDEPTFDPREKDIESSLGPEQVAEIVTLHGAGESGELNDTAGAGQPVGDDKKERPEGEDYPVFAHTPEGPLVEAQMADVPTVEEDGDPDAAEKQAAANEPETDGPDADEHSEARDNLEALNDAQDDPAAKQDEDLVNNSESGDGESLAHRVEDEAKELFADAKALEEKTVEQLKELAREHGINLHGETTKPKIIEGLQKGDKA